MQFQGRLAHAAILIVFSLLPTPNALLRAEESRQQSPIRASFKFDPDDRVLLVPVRVGGKEYPFVLDSGCSVSSFDTSLKQHLGKPTRTIDALSSSGSATTRMEVYSPSHVTVGNVPLRCTSAACFDLARLREVSGYDFSGILGLDFLNEWVVVIDFDQGQIDILSANTMPERDWGECIQVAYKSYEVRYIPAAIGRSRQTAFFALDTGDTGSGNLSGSLFSQLAKSGELRVTGRANAVTFNGAVRDDMGRLSQLRVGTLENSSLRFMNGHGNDVVANHLGLDYLRRFRVVLDFPRERIFLKKGKRFGERDHGTMCGTHLLFTKDGIVVDSVDEKSPAHAAGVRAKDRLVALCGKPVAQLKSSAVFRLLGMEGKKIAMTLDRNGKKVEAAFTLRELD
jgi:hypothetical protein